MSSGLISSEDAAEKSFSFFTSFGMMDLKVATRRACSCGGNFASFSVLDALLTL